MHLSRCKIKPKHQKCELAPWAAINTSPTLQQHFSELSIQPSTKANTEHIKDNKDVKLQKRKMRQVQKHCKNLNVVKNYCKKMYSEPSQNIHQQKHKDILEEYKLMNNTYQMKKIKIIDLNQTLQKSICIKKKRPHSAGSFNGHMNKIIKIQSSIAKYRMSSKSTMANSDYYHHLRPVSRTAVLHSNSTSAVSISPQGKKRVVYPSKNFGALLQNFLKNN